jgi:nucleotide-binding universal stress UspA family protein
MTPVILVATDGTDSALGALRTAYLLSLRDGTPVEVLAVSPPTEIYGAGSAEAAAGFPARLLATSVAVLTERVQGQLDALGGPAASWPIAVEVGAVAPTIARRAALREAGLIVLGLASHPPIEKWIARETLLRVIHLANTPVLAVDPERRELPHRVVVATDFSEFSRRAIQSALQLAAPDAQVHLVHVTWARSADAGWTDSDQWVRTYRTGVEHHLQAMAAELLEGTRLDIHTHVLKGDPGRELLEFAKEADAELLVAGSHGSGFLGRIMLGSVSSRVVHGARCSLLIAPPEAPARELDSDMGEGEVIAELGRAGEMLLPDPPGSS